MVKLTHWSIYMFLLLCIGICPAFFSQEKQKFISSQRYKFIAVSITGITIITMEGFLLYTIYLAFESGLNVYANSGTGNTIFVLQLIVPAVLQLSQSAFAFAFKDTAIDMLSILYKHICYYAENSTTHEFCVNRCFRWIFIFHGIMFAVFECNILSTLWSSNLPMSLTFSLTFIMLVRPLFCFIVMSSYIYIVHVLQHIFVFYNQKLKTISIALLNKEFPQRHKLKEILVLRAELISLCCKEITQIYGITMLLETCYVLSLLPALPQVVLSLLDWGILNNTRNLVLVLRAFIWVLPLFLILIQALAINIMNYEARRTVKMIYKLPRTGTGLDKMVDKFLMKNIRNKPFLTAYGFFTLEQKSLYALFAGILMYFVILVQFMDIEKSSSHNK